MSKLVLVVAMAIFSSTLMAKVEEGTVLKEIWTCKGEKNSYVSSVKATIDHVKNSATGSLVDGTMSSDKIDLSLSKDKIHLEGGVMGHDSRDYSVQLVANRNDDLDTYSSAESTVGQAVVIYGGFIDCVGDVGGAEVLSCEVKIERAK